MTNCGDCRYFVGWHPDRRMPSNSPVVEGECHTDPPRLTPEGKSRWPYVKVTDCCGHGVKRGPDEFATVKLTTD